MRYAKLLLSALITIVAAMVLCAALVHFAPGSGSDERELDGRLSAHSVQAIRNAHATTFWGSLKSLGSTESQAFSRPIGDLLRERIPVTAKPLFAGVLVGWAAAFALALLNRIWGPFLAGWSCNMSSWLLCVPAPVIALALLTRSASPETAVYWVAIVVALIVFPRMLMLSDRILATGSRSWHAEYARTKGLSRSRILLAHVVWPAAPALLAIAGSSVGVALSGVMPVEVVCDSPGIGQLAWLATQQRDLPLLVAITLLVTITAVMASSLSDFAK